MRATRYKSDEFAEYSRYVAMLGEDNSETRSRLLRNLGRAMNEELTPRQKLMLEMYYIQGLKMAEISRALSVNISTVSRNIGRGRARLKRCLRYGAKELLSQDED